jgi:hypothetical protein
MRRKSNERKTNHKPVRLMAPGLGETKVALHTGHVSQYRPYYKRTIERLFRLQSFPPKATKKPPKEQTKAVLRLSDLNAVVEAIRRRVDDQRRDHQRTLRRSSNRK